MVDIFSFEPSFKSWAPTAQEFRTFTENNKYYKARATLSKPVNINILSATIEKKPIVPIHLAIAINMSKQINIFYEREKLFTIIREEAVQLFARMEACGGGGGKPNFMAFDRHCVICDIEKMEQTVIFQLRQQMETFKNFRNFIFHKDNYGHYSKLCRKHQPFDAGNTYPKPSHNRTPLWRMNAASDIRNMNFTPNTNANDVLKPEARRARHSHHSQITDCEQCDPLSDLFDYFLQPNPKWKRMPYTKMIKLEKEDAGEPCYVNKKMAAKFPTVYFEGKY